MVCVQESYLHSNMFASSFPRNAYMSQYVETSGLFNVHHDSLSIEGQVCWNCPMKEVSSVKNNHGCFNYVVPILGIALFCNTI
jgi:hypothetical protein